MKDIAELLKPRRKCIALWPFAKANEVLGKIYIDPKGKKGWEWWEEISKHPHLFTELFWWQDRSVEEMPEYIKKREGQKPEDKNIYKVTKYQILDDGYLAHFKEGYGGYQHISWFVPATETEYLNFKTKEGNT